MSAGSTTTVKGHTLNILAEAEEPLPRCCHLPPGARFPDSTSCAHMPARFGEWDAIMFGGWRAPPSPLIARTIPSKEISARKRIKTEAQRDASSVFGKIPHSAGQEFARVLPEKGTCSAGVPGRPGFGEMGGAPWAGPGLPRFSRRSAPSPRYFAKDFTAAASSSFTSKTV
jgi:hypothetical protein